MRNRAYNRPTLTKNRADGQALGTNDLSENIRADVREELQRLVPSSQLKVAAISDIVRDLIEQSMRAPASPQPDTMSYAILARRPVPPPRSRQGPVTP